MFTCGGCDHKWSGLLIAHCDACHKTFTTIKTFDRHRDSGMCRNPKFARRTDGKPLFKRSTRGRDTWAFYTEDANGTPSVRPGSCGEDL